MYEYEMDTSSLWNIQSGYDSVHRRINGWTDKIKPKYFF